MKRRKVVVAVISFIIVFSMGVSGYKFIQNEISQNKKISELQNDIVFLKTELKEQNDSTRVNYSDTAFNYVAIGNSITKHVINDYWWNEIGMAATSQDKDYVHLISSYVRRFTRRSLHECGEFFSLGNAGSRQSRNLSDIRLLLR